MYRAEQELAQMGDMLRGAGVFLEWIILPLLLVCVAIGIIMGICYWQDEMSRRRCAVSVRTGDHQDPLRKDFEDL